MFSLVIFYFTYSPNLIYSSCAAIDILTGGYQTNITAGKGIFQASIIILMFIGALNLIPLQPLPPKAAFSISSMALPAKIYFIVLGLLGGCAFSMAGGIRIQRIQKLIDAIRKKEDSPTRDELKTFIIYIITFISFLFLLSYAFSFSGNSMLDSVFKIGSALSTNGVSMGATTINLAIGYKWLIIVAMLVGRIEIITIYRALRGTGD